MKKQTLAKALLPMFLLGTPAHASNRSISRSNKDKFKAISVQSSGEARAINEKSLPDETSNYAANPFNVFGTKSTPIKKHLKAQDDVLNFLEQEGLLSSSSISLNMLSGDLRSQQNRKEFAHASGYNHCHASWGGTYNTKTTTYYNATNCAAWGGTWHTKVTSPVVTSTTAKNKTSTSFDLDVSMNEASTVYAVLVISSKPAPTSAQVIAGTDGSDTAAAQVKTLAVSNSGTIAFTGLDSNSKYLVYLVGKDGDNEVSSEPTIVNPGYQTAEISAIGNWKFPMARTDASGNFYISHWLSTSSSFNFLKWDGSDFVNFTSFNAADVTAQIPSVSNASIGSSGRMDYEIDASGNIHILFNASTSNMAVDNDQYYGKYNGTTWTFEKIAETGYLADGADLVVDSSGKIHVSFRNWSASGHIMRYATNKSGSWVLSTIIQATSTGTDEIHDSYVVVDSSGNATVIYRREDLQNNGQDNYYMTSSSNSFSTQTKILDGKTDLKVYRIAAVEIDVSDKIYYAYSNETDGTSHFATNATGSWVTTDIISAGHAILSVQDIRLQGNTRYFLMYSGGKYFFKSYDGTTWVEGFDFEINGYMHDRMAISTLSDRAVVVSENSADWTIHYHTAEIPDYIIAIDPNVTPTISTPPASITVIEDVESNIDLSTIVFADADGDSLTVTLTASAGTFSTPIDGVGVTETLVNATTITLVGSGDDITTYLDATTNIKYTTALNDTTARKIAIKANDGTIDSAISNVTVSITDIADITSDVVPGNSTYGFSDNLDFSISFDESVSVTGTPRIPLDIGGVTKYATFISGNVTATSGTVLAFRYTVEAGLVDPNGINVTNSIDLNGGSIVDTDADGSGADLSNISFASTASVLVDGTAPTITAVAIPIGVHKVGDTVTATITVSSDSDDYTTGSGALTGTINGYTLGSLTKTNDTTYTATFSVTDGGSDVASGTDVAVNFTLADSSGNTSGAFTTAISQTSDAIYANLPDVDLTASTNTIAEDGGLSTLTATLSGSLNNQWPTGITVNLAYTGTGTSGTDYSKSDIIVIASGNSSNTMSITGIPDTLFDAAAAETAIVDISSVSIGNEGSTNQQTITIIDAEIAPTVTLSVGSASVAENGGTSSITATLSHGTYDSTVVNTSYSGTAVGGGTDYNTPSSSITINAGSLTANAATGITAVDDGNSDGNLTIIIDVDSVTGSASENGIQQKTVTIIDDDNTAPTLTNLLAAYTVTEDVASAINLSAATFADTEGDNLTVTLALNSGTISSMDGNGVSSNVTIANSGTSSMTIAGAIANIHTYLDTANKIKVTTANNSITDITLTVTPNDGVVSGTPVTSTLSVTSVNDKPTLTATSSNPTFTENGSAASLFTNAGVSTIESGQAITALMVTVTNVDNTNNEVLNLDGSAISLIVGSGTTATNSFGYSVAVVGTTATVTLSGGSVTDASMQTLVNAISYQNNSEKPITTNTRVVTLTSISDDGGTANGGDFVSAIYVSSMVTVVAVNDIPVIAHIDGDSFTYNEDSGAVIIDQTSALTLTDVDSADFDSGAVTVSITSGEDAAEDLLSLSVASTVSLVANTAGADVSVDNIIIGTLANNIAEGNDLVVNLNANATPANIQTLLRAITYSNTDSGAPTTGVRNVRTIVTDGDGGTSANNDVTITIAGVNDSADIGGDLTGGTIEDNGTGATGSLTITDVDINESTFTAQTANTTTYGTFSVDTSGNWTYDLDSSKAAVQVLANGATMTDIITIASVDGTQKQITITITGVNGVATITGISTGATTEDDATQITGSLAITDEDTGEAVFVTQSNAAGSYGAFNLATSGNWTYDLDSTKAAVQALPTGATLTDSFTATTLDGTDSQLVTITITGVNKAIQQVLTVYLT